VAYSSFNFKTKKALKEALTRGEVVLAWQPGPYPLEVRRGTVYLEGPHYPAAHTWYATATVDAGGRITKVK
jgi:hypothetical protein